MPYAALLSRFYPPFDRRKRSLREQTLQGGPDEGQGEEQGGAVEEGVDLAGSAPRQLDQDVGDEAEPYSVRDVEGQRQRQDGQEGGDRIVEAFPGYETDGCHHQEPDHYQRRSRHRGGEDLLPLLRAGDGYRAAEDRDQGRERQREKEEHPDHHARKTRPASFGDTRPALYVARHRAGAQRPAPAAARESTSRILWSRGGRPFSSRSFPSWPTAITVPIVSKKSVMNRAKITGMSEICNTCGIASTPPPMVEVSKRKSTMPLGRGTMPKIIPTTPVSKMPSKMPPRIPRATSTSVSTSPKSASRTGPCVKSPKVT